MADFCTCGAQLPEDALFCHKCGKPQREILEPEVEENVYVAAAPEVVPIPPPVTPPQPLPLNFHNPIAVRIALLAAISSTILSVLQPLLSWLGAGFFAVYLYRWKTGLRLDVGSGVKIGWITGLISYVFYAILFAVPAVLSGEFRNEFVERMKHARFQDPVAVQQLTDAIQSQPGMVLAVLLVALFVFVIGLSVVGGALGAKIARNPK